MSLNFQFAVISDLHITLPHTLWDGPNRLHLVEVSIPVFEEILARLAKLDLDFLLLPGDLTQHGESANHAWVADRLRQLPYPVYVIPGNHDVPTLHRDAQSTGFAEFPGFYREFGYAHTDRHYYTQEIHPGLRLIALNSNTFDADGNQVGVIDAAQMAWLVDILDRVQDEYVIVMIHHNVIEHMPGQMQDPLGKRYILQNASELLGHLRGAGVQIVLTGHLHIQNIAQQGDIYDITTGSLVSYPHPYRVMRFETDDLNRQTLHVASDRVEAVPDWESLLEHTRNLMNDRSAAYMLQLLTQEPWCLSKREAVKLLPHLREFWATFAAGDAKFDLPDLPEPLRGHFERFSSCQQWDNHAVLRLASPRKSTVHPILFAPPYSSPAR
ncbi:metallophosphoesterase [filamentous cyanobacterium LEGE 11480]|uniref:Metallophosphoesterase n=1 Tax=Romeriopsis navalis LEGE 11480 TaxID=2777977 RepID=A0A928VTB8_9CYAN|nr:metallophosphoesterase [Romeriopsis navalis]MBE9032666.1 metallophosphoesterase [Romeriopsis navalis LEGE 11480]